MDESEGRPATKVPLANPFAVAVDAHANVYVSENFRVRKINPDGTIITVAGLAGQCLTQSSKGSGRRPQRTSDAGTI